MSRSRPSLGLIILALALFVFGLVSNRSFLFIAVVFLAISIIVMRNDRRQ